MIDVRLPEWAAWLDVPVNQDFEAVRHRVLWGGRGGAKSWTIAHKLVERARCEPIRILCTREYQNSIRDSAKKLIEDSTERMGLLRFFTITDREIRGRNGSVITFLGLNGRDAAIKSLEGFDIAWVEEAATISQASLDALIPTIRKEGSEIWWSYNPRYPSDPVDLLFRGHKPPPGSIVVEVHYHDNPWFPEVLRRDMEFDRERDPEKHAHVWLGRYLEKSEAQVFRNWRSLPFATPEDAIFRFGADWGFSVDPTVLVRCFLGSWEGDVGRSEIMPDPDGDYLFIDHEAYEVGCPIDDLPALFAGTDRRLPSRWENPRLHPGIECAATSQITADSARPETIDFMERRGFTIEAAIKGPGSIEDGIEFLKSKQMIVHPRCQHLIDELMHYSWAVDPRTGEILNRLADRNNHVIDALRYALEGAHRARTERFTFASAGPRISAGRNLDHFTLGRSSVRETGNGFASVQRRSRGVMDW